MSKLYGQPTAISGTNKKPINPALDANAPEPKWKKEERERKAKEQASRDEFIAKRKMEQEAEDAARLKRAEEAAARMEKGEVVVNERFKGGDRDVERELASLDALDAMFDAVLK